MTVYFPKSITLDFFVRRTKKYRRNRKCKRCKKKLSVYNPKNICNACWLNSIDNMEGTIIGKNEKDYKTPANRINFVSRPWKKDDPRRKKTYKTGTKKK